MDQVIEHAGLKRGHILRQHRFGESVRSEGSGHDRQEPHDPAPAQEPAGSPVHGRVHAAESSSLW